MFTRKDWTNAKKKSGKNLVAAKKSDIGPNLDKYHKAKDNKTRETVLKNLEAGHNDPPWVSRRLGSLDSNQWLVGVGGSVGGLEVVG